MMWVAVLLSILIGCSLWIWSSLHNAPEGYEDGNGFHFNWKRARGSQVLAKKKRDPSEEPVPALKGMKA